MLPNPFLIIIMEDGVTGQQQRAEKEVYFYLQNLLPKGRGALSRAKDKTEHHLEAKGASDSLSHTPVKQGSTTGKCILKQKSGLIQQMKTKRSLSPELKDVVYGSAIGFFQSVFYFDLF